MLQKNWQELIKPSKIQFTPGNDKLRDATLVVEPLERGFGQTLGNALRRVLLSSIRGAADCTGRVRSTALMPLCQGRLTVTLLACVIR